MIQGKYYILKKPLEFCNPDKRYGIEVAPVV